MPRSGSFILGIKWKSQGLKYLGTLITTRNDTSAEINNRITLANRSHFGMINMLKAKNINRKHMVIMYKTLIKPVLMYGAETWILNKVDELRLGVLNIKENLWAHM